MSKKMIPEHYYLVCDICGEEKQIKKDEDLVYSHWFILSVRILQSHKPQEFDICSKCFYDKVPEQVQELFDYAEHQRESPRGFV